MKIWYFVFLFVLSTITGLAQNKYTISGYIKDSLNGETLIGASIAVQGQTKGITSNLYGFYSITLEEGKYLLICTFIGYRVKAVSINLTADTRINFEVLPKSYLAEEVVVSSKKRDANVKNAQMGKFTLPMEQIRSIPAFLGEVDLLKTIQFLPGVVERFRRESPKSRIVIHSLGAQVDYIRQLSDGDLDLVIANC